MCHRNVFYYNAPFITEIPKCVPNKLSPQVYNDTVGYTEAMDDLVEELDCFFGRCLNQGHVLYPFEKFINQDEYKLEVTWCWFKGSDHIQSPACKGLRGWYGLDLMGWHANSF
jgi:hypothetical protein